MKADQAKGNLKYERGVGPLKIKATADMAMWWGRGEFGLVAKVGGSVGDYKLLSADAVRRAKQVQESRQRSNSSDVGDQVKFLDLDPDLMFLPSVRP